MGHPLGRSWVIALASAALVITVVCPALALDYGSLGPSDETYVVPPVEDDCTGTLTAHHGGSFENAYCWQLSGCVPPYGGAFGEGFEGPAYLECAAIWAAQIGAYTGQPFDIYVWQGGVTGTPGVVLYTAPGATLSNVGMWPAVGQSNIALGYYASESEFTLGFWADNRVQQCPWYVASDTNGPAGHPWTDIVPGIGFPSGWRSPAVVGGWGPVTSLGIGYYTLETAVTPRPADGQALRVLPARGGGRGHQVVYQTCEDGWVRIDVLDGNGRCMDTVVDAYAPAGEHSADWQGHARDGRALPAGIYVLMMRSAAGTETAKAMVLR
jgi:hypothetical protein